MLDCLILGDSLAVGVGQARPACRTDATVGITSAAFLQAHARALPLAANHVVISLGVNDDGTVNTAANLRRLRAGITAGRVTWLLPALKDEVRRLIRTVAAEKNDHVLDTAGQAGPDRLHPGPDGYRRIAAWTQGGDTPPAPAPASPAVPRRLATGPVTITMPGFNARPSGLPAVQMPGSIYGAVSAGPFAAIPPRDYAFRALPRGGLN